MIIETHKKLIRESLEAIREAVQTGVEKRQRTIGFHCSAAAVDMLEVWLHEQNLLGIGAILKHDWFSSVQNAERRLKMPFENKEKLIRLLVDLEKKRNILCYGKAQPKAEIERYLELFNEIKQMLFDMGLEL
jgi:hypothetical protein